MPINPLSYWREIGIVAILFFAYTQWSARRAAESDKTTLTEKITDLELESEQLRRTISQREVTTIITEKHPDGTVIEKKVVSKEKTKVSQKDSVSKKEGSEETTATHTAVNAMERYEIGISRNMRGASYNVDFGARLGNLPFDAVIEGIDNFHDVAIGVRYKW